MRKISFAKETYLEAVKKFKTHQLSRVAKLDCHKLVFDQGAFPIIKTRNKASHLFETNFSSFAPKKFQIRFQFYSTIGQVFFTIAHRQSTAYFPAEKLERFFDAFITSLVQAKQPLKA